MEKGCKEDIHARSVLRLSLKGRLDRGKGDFLVVFGEGIGVQTTIMHHTSIKQPWTSQEDMTSVYWHNNITPNFILVTLANRKTKQTLRRDLQAFTLIESLDGVRAWVW